MTPSLVMSCSSLYSLSKQMKQPVTESWWKLRRKTLMNYSWNIRSANYWKVYFLHEIESKFDALVLIIVLFDIHQFCSWFCLFAGNWAFHRWQKSLAASWKGKPCHLGNVLMSLFFTNSWLKERECWPRPLLCHPHSQIFFFRANWD